MVGAKTRKHDLFLLLIICFSFIGVSFYWRASSRDLFKLQMNFCSLISTGIKWIRVPFQTLNAAIVVN